MHPRITIALLGLLAAFSAAPALCAVPSIPNPAEAPNPNDPTVGQVYDAARAGHLDQAKQMMTIVLANHPHSARAHYVMAELDGDLKNFAEARQELKAAEDLDPGLPNMNPRDLEALRKQIGAPPPTPVAPGAAEASAAAAASAQAAASAAPAVSATAAASEAPAASAEPAAKASHRGMLLLIGAVVILLWFILRRRAAPPAYAPNTGAAPNAPAPAAPPGGSGIVGGLASGLAVGAGVVAGEELMRHAFEPHHEGHEAGAGTAVSPEPLDGAGNSDLGGPNFGISDPGGSWDDSSASSGDDGGGDWT